MTDLLLRRGAVDGSIVDLRISDGRITAIGRSLPQRERR